MTVVPAIDLRAGRCVRLVQGDPARELRYEGAPAERARAFEAAGARKLHVVDLDGAFGSGENLAALRAICAAVGVQVRAGGGVRNAEEVRVRLAAGASEVVLGTLLVEDAALARALLAEFGAEHIVAGVDVRGEQVAIRGWQVSAPLARDPFLRELCEAGFARAIVTEIGRDGTGSGYDRSLMHALAREFPLRFTASGGARTLDDLRALAAGAPPNLDEAIVGRALYDGTLALVDAFALGTSST